MTAFIFLFDIKTGFLIENTEEQLWRYMRNW